MATSKIKKNKILKITGTLGNDTEDYFIHNVVPTGYKVMCGQYTTTYNQLRPIEVGQSGSSLVIQSPVASMANRPYEVYLFGGGVNTSLPSANSPGVHHDEYNKEVSTRGSELINRRDRNNYDSIPKAVWNRISDLVWRPSFCDWYKISDDYDHNAISEWKRRTCSDSERRLQLHPVRSSMVQLSLLHRSAVINTISREEVAA